MDVESDTCLVVVTVFKIVASALRVEGWVRFPPSPPAFARAARELRLGRAPRDPVRRANDRRRLSRRSPPQADEVGHYIRE